MPVADVHKEYTTSGRDKSQAKKTPKVRGNLRGRGREDPGERFASGWRFREVSQPWMPLRASEDFEHRLQGKLQLPEKSLELIHFMKS
jgi:hypothetical protein